MSTKRKHRKHRSGHNSDMKDHDGCVNYLMGIGSGKTQKDQMFIDYMETRSQEIVTKSGSDDAFIFSIATLAVSEFERLYDLIDKTVREHIPDVDVDAFFRTVTMYLGKDADNKAYYVTDWKTFMFAIAASIPEANRFPVLGYHYKLYLCAEGILELEKKDGQCIAQIPVLRNTHMENTGVSPQCMKNLNLAHIWWDWYLPHAVIDCGDQFCKLSQYYDEVLEYCQSHNLFNKKKVQRETV